jgi:methylase of polypeptide subunit release factors
LHDFYPTPPSATEALLSVERFEGKIWECACGNGAISKVLEAHGHKVLSTDLVDRGYGKTPVDFLGASPLRTVDNIVTNPPYTLAERFVRTALSVATDKVAMLLKLAFLEGEKRRRMFESTPLARVHVFSRRLTMMRNGAPPRSGGMIAFAWFVWEHGYTGSPRLHWLDTAQNWRRNDNGEHQIA